MNTSVNYALRARYRSAFTSSGGAGEGSSLLWRRMSTKPRVSEAKNVDLVGPTGPSGSDVQSWRMPRCDPVSNIRPVHYASAQYNRSSSASTSTSPYSTSEFTNVEEEASDRVRADERIGEDLEWRLRRERVDAKNHEFWAITNTLFQTHLDHRLRTQLPPAPAADAPEETITAYNKAKDAVLTEFYRDWLEANKARQSRWIWQWWGDVRHEVWDGLKRSFTRR
ncbi:hypothetical protein QFC21_000557 [Naganishia friedmannii]|uniref:Uncharacterized protein n=1 Tax=Naganishia friedmannii TaxID=89922 RepID=A0ACC2WCM2_9TREE|nr:hypothetical protein QFC21_000557 [Naganishia friedmannii]